MDATITTNNTALSRFELIKNGHMAYADYKQDNSVLTIRFVFAPEDLRGTGAASELMSGIVAYTVAQNLKIIPICGYAAAWLRKHPEFAHLIA